MMNRTTIMLPEALKTKAMRIADKRGISLGELIREGLFRVCANHAKSKDRDPFFADHHLYDKATPRKLAEKHDDYLYGTDS